MAVNNPADFYRLDELCFNEEEKMVRDTARSFVEKEILPKIKELDRGVLPDGVKSQEEVVRSTALKLASITKVFGCTLPGMGKYLPEGEFVPYSHKAYGVALRELEAADTALRSLVSVQSSLSMFAIYQYGSEEQKKKWLPPLYQGKKIACFGLTEPSGGSDPAHMMTQAKKTSKGWTLNGNKVWITNGFADIAVVWAKTADGIRGFLVEKGMPGFSFRHEEKWTLRAGVASSLAFVNCEIPEGNLLPGTIQPAGGKDLASALRCLNEARYGINWGAIGAARACFEEALEFAKGRQLFGEPLAAKQETQRKLVWMLNEIQNAQLVALHLAELKEKKLLDHTHVSLAKYNNVAKALEIAQLAVEILSADVFTFDAYHSGRHLRNLEIVKKYEGAHEVHWLIVGRAITGHAAF